MCTLDYVINGEVTERMGLQNPNCFQGHCTVHCTYDDTHASEIVAFAGSKCTKIHLNQRYI